MKVRWLHITPPRSGSESKKFSQKKDLYTESSINRIFTIKGLLALLFYMKGVKMLRVILVVVIIAVSFFLIGCSDSTTVSSTSEDTAVTVDAGVLTDAVASGDVTADDTSGVVVADDVTAGDDVWEVANATDSQAEVDVFENLPSDPTENPEGSESESAHYSFPDWEVPSSNDDNR